jgi:putative ABC transport system permease protein
MSDLAFTAAGLLATFVVLALVLLLVISVPFVAVAAALVTARREWIPISYNLRSLARRKVATLSAFAVLSLVVFVLTAMLMLAEGISHTLATAGDPSNVKIVNNKSLSEWTSFLSAEVIPQLGALPGVSRSAAGVPLVSGETVVLVWAPHTNALDPDDGGSIAVRGVWPIAFDLHRLSIQHGRLFTTGKYEIVIGKALRGRFAGAELGGHMNFAERDWLVVGIADHGGSALDSEIWGDFEVMDATFDRGYSTATLALAEGASPSEISTVLASDPQKSELVAVREVDYWRALSDKPSRFVRLFGGVIGLVFSFGAILGGLNTMYAQVRSRSRELGTLRAIGFKARAVLVSIVVESILLALFAGVVGVFAASLLHRATFELSTEQTLTEITYAFHLSPALVLAGLAFACLLGYAGGLLPALRAARTPIVQAVRAD